MVRARAPLPCAPPRRHAPRTRPERYALCACAAAAARARSATHNRRFVTCAAAAAAAAAVFDATPRRCRVACRQAAIDPAITTHYAWRGDPVARSAVPTLYYSEGSYFSQVARLCLVEKGAPWKSRLMDLHTLMEQARGALWAGVGVRGGVAWRRARRRSIWDGA
jgi:hypothetical protein